MSLEKLTVYYLVLHAIVCILIFVGIKIRLLRFSEQLMPIIVLVPIAGVLMAISAQYNTMRHLAGQREITLEDAHLSEDDLRLQKVESEQSNDMVVPLEEAMSVNDVSVRRKLMLDILKQNPKAYMDLLQEARMDQDLEVTHYASTAIMEIQREYELSLQKAEQEYKNEPEDYQKLNQYLKNLQRYIESGLVDENIESLYRTRYAEVLREKLQMEPENLSVRLQALDNYLAMDNITEALMLANEMVANWPTREKAWFAKLKVCQHSGDGKGIQEVISQIRKRNVYLSPEGKNIVSFWSDEGTGEDHFAEDE